MPTLIKALRDFYRRCRATIGYARTIHEAQKHGSIHSVTPEEEARWHAGDAVDGSLPHGGTPQVL